MPTWFDRIASRFASPRPRRGRRGTALAAEVLEDRVMPTGAAGLHDFEVVGRTSGGQWWAGGYDAEPAGDETGFQNERFADWNGAIGWQTVRYGDFDGDSLDDVIGRDPATGYWWVSLSDGTGSTFKRAGHWSTATSWSDVSVVDLAPDADDRPGAHDFTFKDDLVGRASNGQWWALVSNGDGTFTNRLLTTWNPAGGWRDVRFLDINRDAATDIVGRASNGQWWAARSSTGPGNIGLDYRNVLLASWNEAAGWHDVLVSDTFLSPNRRGAILARTATGDWYALGFDTGAPVTTSLGRWNEAARWRDVMVTNLDGDNRDELVGRTAAGEWWQSWWNGSALVTRKIGTWAESAGWQDVQVAALRNPSGFDAEVGDAIVGRAANGQWWLSRILKGTSTLTKTLIGTWNPAAGWRDVRVANVTRSPVATLGHIANGVQSLHVNIYAPRTGSKVTINNYIPLDPIFGNPGVTIQCLHLPSSDPNHTVRFFESSFIATPDWRITVNGHLGKDEIFNYSRRPVVAFGRGGHDYFWGENNGALDYFDSGSGFDAYSLDDTDVLI